MSGEARGFVIIFVFIVLLYLIQSSISSLSEVNLLTGKFKEAALEQEIRYERALTDDLESTQLKIPVKIRKCCHTNEIFNKDLKCIPSKTPLENGADFFPRRMLVDKDFFEAPSSAFEKLEPVYDGHVCNDEVHFITDQNVSHHFIRFETGELLRTMVTLRNGTAVNYSMNYCAEKIEDERYVIMTCPCQNHVCVQKCCPFDEYYNTKAYKCIKIEGLHIPSSVEGSQFTNQSNFFLIHRPLDCNNEANVLIEGFNKERGVTIRQDGYLLHEHDKMRVEKNSKSYCIDSFSDGTNISQIHGFYCQDVKHSRTVRDTKEILNKCCKEGESLNELFQCKKNQPNANSWTPTPQLMGNRFSSFEHKNFTVPDDVLSLQLKKTDFVLHIRNKKEEKLYIKDILRSYPSEFFCIDGYEKPYSEYAVIFSPCQKKLCLHKCCPYGSRYDTETYNCSKFSKNIHTIIDVVLLSETGILTDPVNYFLIHDNRTCQMNQLYRRIYPYSLGADKLYVQRNGMLLKMHRYSKAESISPRRYCIDLFSGNGMSLVNGFFCVKGKRKSRKGGSGDRDINLANKHVLSATMCSIYLLLSLFIRLCFLDVI